jgi:hypothetical protein
LKMGIRRMANWGCILLLKDKHLFTTETRSTRRSDYFIWRREAAK